MSPEELPADAQIIYDAILIMVMGVMSIHFLAVVLVFFAVLTLYKNSKRPGTKIMFICTSLVLISMTVNYFAEQYVGSSYAEGQAITEFYFNEFFSWGWSLLNACLICIGSYGFFKFSRSFKTENEQTTE